MYHLGIGYGHCATVALIRDGALVFCQSEERLNRLKNSTGFPSRTLAALYETIGGPEQIASCTLLNRPPVGGYAFMKQRGFQPAQMNPHLDPALIDGWAADLAQQARVEQGSRDYEALLFADPGMRAESDRWFAEAIGLPADRIEAVDHHVGHVLSVLPFLETPERDVLIFTLDGEGDGLSGSVSLLRDGVVTNLGATADLLSLGRLYATVTGILGFSMFEHEYKVMGLAPYAKPEYTRRLLEKFSALLRVDEKGVWHGAFASKAEMVVKLVELCRFERFDAIAAAVQTLTETLICQWVQRWIQRTGIHAIACAGGVFMNVKANQRLAELPEVEALTIVPSCGDESAAIGCAVSGARRHQPAVRFAPTRSLALGMNFSDEAVLRYLIDQRIAERFDIAEPPDIEVAIAQRLAEGHVVARCSGPMEFGARALGNRSILAHPAKPELVGLINDAIKNRDFWMPFAPSILAEEADALTVNPKRLDSRFMMIAFDATARGRAALPAALHRADFTLRPQLVERAASPAYHGLIAAFRAITGIGAVLNTSFNLHGEPIVCSPADAVETVARSGLVYLALNRFLLTKRA